MAKNEIHYNDISNTSKKQQTYVCEKYNNDYIL